MGFFNFLYKLSNIFINKKRLKFFIVVGFIFLLLLSLHNKGYCSEATDSDALTSYQLQFQNTALCYLEYLKASNKVNSSTFDTFLTRLTRFNIYVTTTISDNAQFLIYLYLNNVDANTSYNDLNDFTINGSWELGVLPDGTISGTEFPCKLAQFQGYCYRVNRYDVNGLETIEPAVWTSFYLPAPCYMVRSVKVTEFLREYNAFNELPTTYNTSDEELQAIASTGLANLNNSINQQTNTMTNSINSASSSITNSINSVENTLKDTTTDDSQIEFAQDNNQDITSGFFTNLYDTIKTNFSDTSLKYASIEIPFTNKSFVISSVYVLNYIKRNQKFAIIVTLSESAWWFALGYYVILDIYKKINAIKSGDLTNIENENITTDLL